MRVDELRDTLRKVKAELDKLGLNYLCVIGDTANDPTLFAEIYHNEGQQEPFNSCRKIVVAYDDQIGVDSGKDWNNAS